MSRYDAQTSIKASQAELDAWRAAAAEDGMPMYTWMRIVLDHAAGVGELHEQLERASAVRRSEHTAMMRERRAAAAAERKSEG